MMIFESLSFDDVNLIPKYNDKSRKQVSIAMDFAGSVFAHPFISSNMDTITGPKMAAAMHETGGFGILHRFCTIEENLQMFKDAGCVWQGSCDYKSHGV